MASRFPSPENTGSAAGTPQRIIQFIPKVSERNRTTIAALEQQDISQLADMTFTCEASITGFVKGRTWYYSGAPYANRRYIQWNKSSCALKANNKSQNTCTA